MRKSVLLASLISLAVVGGCAVNAAAPAAPSAPLPGGPPVTVVNDPDNGLTVIVQENHTAPVVAVRCYVRAGGIYEGKYLGCGVSHLCEHLVAEGADEQGAGAIAVPATGPTTKPKQDLVDKIGGQFNAYTSHDHTCYYISASSARAQECVDLIAGFMTKPKIGREDFEREHGVVQRELQMGEDSPDRQLSYAHFRNAFVTHPAAVPVIGYRAPLAALKYEDVLDYHGRMYVPQNMVFVVVGDVNAAQASEWVKKAFAGVKAQRVPVLELPEVATVVSTRRVTVTDKTVTEAMEELSFQSITLLSEDLYALDVLSEILSNGESSRLAMNVKRRDRLVTGISTSSWTPEWAKGLFSVSFRGEPEKIDAAEKAIVNELAAVVANGVTPAELAKAKRQKVAEFVYGQQTCDGQASTLGGDYLATSDTKFSRQYTDRIQKLTAADIQAVAAKYFNFNAMVITRMVPAGSAAAVQAPLSGAPQSQVRNFTLPNGLKVVLYATDTVDLVSSVLVTKGGLLLETPPTNGIGTLMAGLSTKGAGPYSSEQIAEFFDSAGGGISGSSNNNTFVWQMTVLSDSFAKALPILSEVVQHPNYPQKELDILRPILLARIRQTDEDWMGQLNKAFRKDFFQDSPLAMLPIGSPEVVKAATRQQIADYHDKTVKAGCSVLAIYGRFDPAAAEGEIRSSFAGMAGGDNAVPNYPPRKVLSEGETFIQKTKLKGSGVIVAAPGMKITDADDVVAMTVLDTIISGYHLPRGWLHDELRGKKLVYVVHAYNFPSLVPGAFVSYAHCEPDKSQEVAKIIGDDFHKTATYKFTQAEVDEAVNIILTADAIDNQQMSSLAMQAALDDLYGLGWDYRAKRDAKLKAMTPEQVGQVGKKYLSSSLVTVILSPESTAPPVQEKPAPQE